MNNINLKELTLENYPLKTYDKIRYNDTDKQLHVNNAVFSTFVETGRNELVYDPKLNLTHDSTYVIASLSLDYIAEIIWPGTVDIGTAVSDIKNSSFKLLQGVYQNGQLVAAAESIVVQVDNQTKRSKPLTAANKKVLSSFPLITPK